MRAIARILLTAAWIVGNSSASDVIINGLPIPHVHLAIGTEEFRFELNPTLDPGEYRGSGSTSTAGASLHASAGAFLDYRPGGRWPGIQFSFEAWNSSLTDQTFNIRIESPLYMPDGSFDWYLGLYYFLIPDLTFSRPDTLTPINSHVLTGSLTGPSLFVAALDADGLVVPTHHEWEDEAIGIGRRGGTKSGNTGASVELSFTLSPQAFVDSPRGHFYLDSKATPVPETGSSRWMLGLAIATVGLVARKKRKIG